MSRSPSSSSADDSELASGERLQKVMAAAGVASRRVSEDMIAAGRVTVNGKVVTEPGRRIDPTTDKIVVDGSAVQLDATRRYVMLNKPVGIVSTLSDENGRPDLRQFTEQYEERLFNVGRLDVETSGLLVLTNDGELAHVLAHPSFGVTKTYIAKVKGVVTPAVLNELTSGVELDDGPIAADRATLVAGGAGLSRSTDSSLIEITLHSGRNRIVRRMLEAVGHPVVDLVRRSFGPLHLGTLKVGHMRSLTKVELGAILTISRDATSAATVDAAPITESPDAPVDEADVVELALADDEVEKDYYDEDDEEYDPATDARAERRRAAARDQAESTSRRAQVRREQEARRGQRDERPTRGGYQGNRHDGRGGDERPVRGYQGANDDGRGREGRPARTGYHGSDERPARGGQGRDDRGGYQGRDDRGSYQGRNDDGRGASRGGYQGRNDDGRGRDERPARGGYQGRDDRGGYRGRDDRDGSRGGYQGRNDDGRGRDDRGGFVSRDDRGSRGGFVSRDDRAPRGGGDRPLSPGEERAAGYPNRDANRDPRTGRPSGIRAGGKATNRGWVDRSGERGEDERGGRDDRRATGGGYQGGRDSRDDRGGRDDRGASRGGYQGRDDRGASRGGYQGRDQRDERGGRGDSSGGYQGRDDRGGSRGGGYQGREQRDDRGGSRGGPARGPRDDRAGRDNRGGRDDRGGDRPYRGRPDSGGRGPRGGGRS